MPVSLDLFHSIFSTFGRSLVHIFIFNLDYIGSQTFFMFETVGGGCTLSSGLSKIKIGGTHHALQLECGSLGLFDETIDPRLRIAFRTGKKIELAEVRALQNGADRRLVKDPWVRPSRKRVVPDSRGTPQRMVSPRSTDRRSSPKPRQYHVLSLASAFHLREERSRTSESKLHEKIAMLHEELLKKQKESDEKSKSCDILRLELEEKSKTMGKTLLTSTGEKTIEGYRASSAFRDEVLQQALTIHDQIVVDCRHQFRETKLVSEDIVRMIEPSVPEPGEETNEDLLGTFGKILGDIDDDEMIKALRQHPI
ncbi:hypothetical protein F511_19248 [Dorcoceras hygrometricum]|uniref:Uncharacterized protein n=1 Tax=Dorcoceras hygrometricum TaxID=472368 RepID=A0A2Z7CPK5_9LAMI|nr:hypothetical protein F511_19248 [Dorcoceras hygrometricum]